MLALPVAELEPANQDLVTISVDYAGDDLAEVGRLTGLTADEVIKAHTGQKWTVAFCGFAPGFGYLVGEDDRLRVPRRTDARVWDLDRDPPALLRPGVRVRFAAA